MHGVTTTYPLSPAVVTIDDVRLLPANHMWPLPVVGGACTPPELTDRCDLGDVMVE